MDGRVGELDEVRSVTVSNLIRMAMSNDNDMFEKMMELSMGMTIMKHMAPMMNDAMAGLNPSSATTPPSIAQEPPLYAVINNAQVGPLSRLEVNELIDKNLLCDDTLVWRQGMSSWLPASEVPEVAKMLLLKRR